MTRSANDKYVETAILTASKEDLIVRVFDILVVAAQQAIEKMNADVGDIEGIHRALLRAQRALAVLMGALDMEIGGELSANLFRVYEFWHHELVMANMQKDVSRVERLLPDFIDYRKTWAEAVLQWKAMQRTESEDIQPTASSGFAAVG
ncbi:MAG: flagellar protein FliS [Candidatus Eremiobacteraeota bacterium]|nr:flagellar protein FliS [Candidatus Eremiobacteraeota bacterium]